MIIMLIKKVYFIPVSTSFSSCGIHTIHKVSEATTTPVTFSYFTVNSWDLHNSNMNVNNIIIVIYLFDYPK